MKKLWFSSFLLMMLTVVYAFNLEIPQENMILERSDDGYHLFIKKTGNIQSVMLVEYSPEKIHDTGAFALRALVENPTNGSEKRIINGAFVSNYESLNSLIDSTPELHPQLGLAFHIFIPEEMVFGYPWSRHGRVSLVDEPVLVVRSFERPFADYRGAFADKPFKIEYESPSFIANKEKQGTLETASRNRQQLENKEVSEKLAELDKLIAENKKQKSDLESKEADLAKKLTEVEEKASALETASRNRQQLENKAVSEKLAELDKLIAENKKQKSDLESKEADLAKKLTEVEEKASALEVAQQNRQQLENKAVSEKLAELDKLIAENKKQKSDLESKEADLAKKLSDAGQKVPKMVEGEFSPTLTDAVTFEAVKDYPPENKAALGKAEANAGSTDTSDSGAKEQKNNAVSEAVVRTPKKATRTEKPTPPKTATSAPKKESSTPQRATQKFSQAETIHLVDKRLYNVAEEFLDV